MRGRIKYCDRCEVYTLSDTCPKCNSPTRSAHPAPFSPDDRYLEYKIKMLLIKYGFKVTGSNG